MKKLVLAFCLAFIAACSILPKGAEAPRLFTLNAAPYEAGTAAKPLAAALQILAPQVSPGLDTKRIALKHTSNQIDYYADSRWAGTLGALTQSVLVESFDKRNVLKAVGNDLVPMNKDYSLLVEIRDFQSEYADPGQPPRIHVRMTAKLIRADRNDIIMTHSYETRTSARDNTLQEIIRAFDISYQNVNARLIDDTLKTLKIPHKSITQAQ